jgi:hypothetical protein
VLLSLSLQLEVSQTIDKANAMNISRKILTRPTQEVVELLGVDSVTHVALRKAQQSVNRIIVDAQKSSLPQFCDKLFKRRWDSGLHFPVQPPAIQVSRKL